MELQMNKDMVFDIFSLYCRCKQATLVELCFSYNNPIHMLNCSTLLEKRLQKSDLRTSIFFIYNLWVFQEETKAKLRDLANVFCTPQPQQPESKQVRNYIVQSYIHIQPSYSIRCCAKNGKNFAPWDWKNDKCADKCVIESNSTHL